MTPTVLHIRTHPFSNRHAPFIRQTVLGLRPYFHNVVITPSIDCANPPDVDFEFIEHADLRSPLACLGIAAYLRARYPAVRLVVGHMGNGTRTGRLLARFLGVPLLGTFGGSDINIEMLDARYHDTYRALFATPTTRFLAVADYLRDKLIAAGAPPARTATWHRGVDLGAFEAGARPSRPTARLLISARFYEVKGHAYAIRAVAALRAAGRAVELVLLGDGPLEASLTALAAELGVADAVRFVGHVTHDRVLDHLRDADVYVHPSVACSEGRIEGIPNAIMEAHATGLPVVATAHGGIAEVVRDGESGFLVPERDAAALADRIGRLLDSHELRQRMGLRGRAHIEQEFALAVQSRRLADHIEQAIAAGGTAPEPPRRLLQALTGTDGFRRSAIFLGSRASRLLGRKYSEAVAIRIADAGARAGSVVHGQG